MPLELRRIFGEAQLLLVDDRGIPHGVKIEVAAKPLDLHVVPSAITTFACVQRLMKVADKMDDESQSELLLLKARTRIAQRSAETAQRLQRISFRRRMVVEHAVERHVVPGVRGLLPEGRGGRLHLVRPVRRLLEAFRRPQQLADVRPGKPAELRVGDLRDDAMPGLSPREGGGRHQRDCDGCGGDEQP